MKIGIDIDGVLTNDDDFIIDYATKFCFENNLEDISNPYDYERRNKFNWEKDISKQYNEKYFYEYVVNEPPRKFASEVIKKLKEEGNKIYIITSRRFTASETPDGEKMREAVKVWLKKHDIIYDDIYFSSNKIIQIQELKLDVMIEDNPETIPNFTKYVHIFCYDCRYNRDLNCSNMTKVFSWYDIYSKLRKLRDFIDEKR